MTAADGSALQEVLDSVIGPLERAGFRYMVVGALAVVQYGAPRLTRDADLSVDIAGRRAEEVGEALRDSGLKIEGPDRNQFGVRFIVSHSILPVEVYLSGDHPFTALQFDRARAVDWLGRTYRFISPEDLVLRKLYNLRLRRTPKDLDDAMSILRDQGDQLDVAYMREQARPFRTLGWLDELLREQGISF